MVRIRAGEDIDLAKSLVRSRHRIGIAACGNTVDVTDAVVRACERVWIKFGTLVDTEATIMAATVKLELCDD